jgi:hypothetical protein
VTEEARGEAEGRGRLCTVAVILYGTLALLLLVVPGAVSSRLDDFEPSPAVRAARATVDAVSHVSDALGLATLYKDLRARFLDSAGLQGD